MHFDLLSLTAPSNKEGTSTLSASGFSQCFLDYGFLVVVVSLAELCDVCSSADMTPGKTVAKIHLNKKLPEKSTQKTIYGT